MNQIPPITRALIDALYSPQATDDRKRIVADALAQIGPAFEGIENFNQAGRNEPLTDAVQRFTRQHALPVRIDTLLDLAQRINELSAIVQQNALTSADLAHAGWGVPPQGPQVPEAVKAPSQYDPNPDADPNCSTCNGLGAIWNTEQDGMPCPRTKRARDYICAECGEPRADEDGICPDCLTRCIEVEAAQLSKGDRLAGGLGTVTEVVPQAHGLPVLVYVQTGPTQTRALFREANQVVRVLAKECADCGKYARAVSPGGRCVECEFGVDSDEAKRYVGPSEFQHPDDVATGGF
jgi:hypothetical protein